MNAKVQDKIQAIFEEAPVEVAYLFGSLARGDTGPMSDYDFGVLIERGMNEKQENVTGKLMDKLFAVVGEDKAEVVDLEGKPVVFRFNVIKDGEALVNKNDSRRVAFEFDTMRQFHDQKYYLDREMAITLDQIEKGVFFDRRLLTHHKTT